MPPSVEEVFCDVVALLLPLLRSIFVVVQGQKMKPWTPHSAAASDGGGSQQLKAEPYEATTTTIHPSQQH